MFKQGKHASATGESKTNDLSAVLKQQEWYNWVLELDVTLFLVFSDGNFESVIEIKKKRVCVAWKKNFMLMQCYRNIFKNKPNMLKM